MRMVLRMRGGGGTRGGWVERGEGKLGMQRGRRAARREGKPSGGARAGSSSEGTSRAVTTAEQGARWRSERPQYRRWHVCMGRMLVGIGQGRGDRGFESSREPRTSIDGSDHGGSRNSWRPHQDWIFCHREGMMKERSAAVSDRRTRGSRFWPGIPRQKRHVGSRVTPPRSSAAPLKASTKLGAFGSGTKLLRRDRRRPH